MEPLFTPAKLPRYTQKPFPPYRYLPFQADIPHPRNNPKGHSYGEEEAYISDFNEPDWPACETYLYGVDLFNQGYWWEAHEAWEALWLAAGRETPAGQFLQGLIQLAGAQLKRFTHARRGAQLLTESSCQKLSAFKVIYLGIAIAPLLAEAERCLRENRHEFPRILLQFPPERNKRP
jgi:predicted metal-dependent hydrolase